jgi:hypothetical protein
LSSQKWFPATLTPVGGTGAVILLGETIFGDGSAALKWRAATPMSATSQQYFRLGATLVVRPRPLAG